MRILIAIDSFKGSLSSFDAGDTVRKSLQEALPEAELSCFGIADGGEGSLDVFCRQGGGELHQYPVMGPLPGMTVSGGHAFRESDGIAMIEMAIASGLALMGADPLRPLEATTFGTGECIRRALEDHQPKRLILAVGGSATTDGGMGAARALGWKFLDPQGREIHHGGGSLRTLHQLCPPETRLTLPQVDVLCDVNNPLLGPDGSAAVYGPQKGAGPEDVETLEEGLQRLTEVVQRDLAIDMNVPGAGAAGGLAAGALAFMGAQLCPGVETLMELTGLNERLQDADWLITGEGSLDHQSLRGKVISGLLKKCQSQNIRVGVIAGQVHLTDDQLSEAGIAWALPLMKPGVSLDQAMSQTQTLLGQRATEAIQFLKG